MLLFDYSFMKAEIWLQGFRDFAAITYLVKAVVIYAFLLNGFDGCYYNYITLRRLYAVPLGLSIDILQSHQYYVEQDI